ncbi:MAG: glycosyltransferase family 8 protein [Devosia sp.]|nr:glycosyltransferase family 8 protein [Devosia sp.]
MAPIHVALTFDDGFWAPAYATVRSTALASRRREDLVFHLLHSSLSRTHRERLDSIEPELHVTIEHVELDANEPYRALASDLPVAFWFTPVIYARLILDRLIPEAERITYLDSDVLVRSPIEDVALADLGGTSLAAVNDPHRHRAMLGRDFRLNGSYFDFRQPYFNSGVLVIDRDKYAAANLPDLIGRLNREGALAQMQFDQAVLNIAFKDNWLPLDFRWNLINPEPAHEALEPHIVHYTGPHKPWHLLNRVAFAQAYRHTMTNDIFYAYWRERQFRRLAAPFRRKG